MTLRKFKIRLKEHIADIKYNRSKTALSRLKQEQSIKIDFDNAKIIKPTSSFYQAIISESIEILTRKNKICNDSVSYNIPKLWYKLLQIVQE